MGDKTGTETLRINVPRSVASPAAKERKKTATGTPGQLSTEVLPKRAEGGRTKLTRAQLRRVRDKPEKGAGEASPLRRVRDKPGKLSHSPGHVQQPRTAKQKAATARNFKKMMAAAARRR